MKRPGVPGGLRALFNGEPGVIGISTPAYEECLEASFCAI